MKNNKPPQLKNIVILGQFTDNVYRQFYINERVQHAICSLIIAMDMDGEIKIMDKEIEGISWESKVNLHKKIK